MSFNGANTCGEQTGENRERPPSGLDADSMMAVMEEAETTCGSSRVSAMRITSSVLNVAILSEEVSLLSNVRRTHGNQSQTSSKRMNEKNWRCQSLNNTHNTNTIGQNGAPKVEKSRPETMPVGLTVTPRGIPASTARIIYDKQGYLTSRVKNNAA